MRQQSPEATTWGIYSPRVVSKEADVDVSGRRWREAGPRSPKTEASGIRVVTEVGNRPTELEWLERTARNAIRPGVRWIDHAASGASLAIGRWVRKDRSTMVGAIAVLIGYPVLFSAVGRSMAHTATTRVVAAWVGASIGFLLVFGLFLGFYRQARTGRLPSSSGEDGIQSGQNRGWDVLGWTAMGAGIVIFSLGPAVHTVLSAGTALGVVLVVAWGAVAVQGILAMATDSARQGFVRQFRVRWWQGVALGIGTAAWVTGWFAALTGLLARAGAVQFQQAHPSAGALSAFYLHEGADFVHLAAAFPSWRTLTYTSDGIGTLALMYRLLVLASLLALWHTFVTSARDSRSASVANAETTVDDEARTGPVLAHSVVNPQDGTIMPGKDAEGD